MMNLGTPPKQLGWFERFQLPLTVRPSWMSLFGKNDLGWFISAEKDLKRNGIGVPGTIVQANEQLFSPGDHDHPAELLFSLSPGVDVSALWRLAHEIYALKGKAAADPEEAFFSRYLADELERVRGVKIPARLSLVEQAFVSTTIIYRAHLPGRILKPAIYPVLVSPVSFVAMVLPNKYWTREGRELFERSSR